MKRYAFASWTFLSVDFLTVNQGLQSLAVFLAVVSSIISILKSLKKNPKKEDVEHRRSMADKVKDLIR